MPPASYSLVAQVKGRGVYSFCMCPGGIIAPCATAQEEVVTNGWSPSKRNNPHSNSGIVVSISPNDFKGKEDDPMVCLNFQKSVEYKCWEAGGSTQKVPAQRLMDFLDGKVSKDLPNTSYQPGMKSADLNKVLPTLISDSLRVAFKEFGKKMKRYYTEEANVMLLNLGHHLRYKFQEMNFFNTLMFLDCFLVEKVLVMQEELSQQQLME